MCSARTSTRRDLQQEIGSKSLKDLGSHSWFTVKMKAIRAESMMTSSYSLYYWSQAITENDQQKRNQAEDKKLRQEENARVTKRQKQEERNASIPLEWNQEDYGRLEELTLELLELREQHECVREVVENHNKDIKKVRRSIAALTNKYTLVECNPEDSDKKRKRVAQRNSRVPPQWSSHNIAELEQLQVTLGILITDKEMVGEGHKARAYTIIRRENDIEFLVKTYTPVEIYTDEEEFDDKETEVKVTFRTAMKPIKFDP